MQFTFTPATKTTARVRAAVFGPSGSGKTYSCLRIASGLGGRIAVIDTERGSASKYADRFGFDVLDLPQRDIKTYVAAIHAAGGAGYQVLVIDSLSHAWQELLAEVDKIAKARFRGNTWSAWSEGTPKQQELIGAILDFPGHVLVTMRSKTSWIEEKDERSGKIRPVRVGLSPEQGKGIEYEFDLLLELSTEHVATVIKDRTGKYQDAMLEQPDEAFGAALAAWLAEGEPAPAPAPASAPVPAAPAAVEPPSDEQRQAIRAAFARAEGATDRAQAMAALAKAAGGEVQNPAQVPADRVTAVIQALDDLAGVPAA